MRDRIPAWEGVRTEQYKYVRCFDHDYEFLHDLKRIRTNSPISPLIRPMPGPWPRCGSAPANSSRNTGGNCRLEGGIQVLDRTAHPAASAAVGTRPDKEGFVRLFDGKSLRGWEGDPQFWSVEGRGHHRETDGTLKMNRFLTWTGSTIRNFDLRVMVKVTSAATAACNTADGCVPRSGLDIVSGYQCGRGRRQSDYNGNALRGAREAHPLPHRRKR